MKLHFAARSRRTDRIHCVKTGLSGYVLFQSRKNLGYGLNKNRGLYTVGLVQCSLLPLVGTNV